MTTVPPGAENPMPLIELLTEEEAMNDADNRMRLCKEIEAAEIGGVQAAEFVHITEVARQHNAKRNLIRGPIGLELKIMRHIWEVAGYNAYRLYFNSDSFCTL